MMIWLLDSWCDTRDRKFGSRHW